MILSVNCVCIINIIMLKSHLLKSRIKFKRKFLFRDIDSKSEFDFFKSSFSFMRRAWSAVIIQFSSIVCKVMTYLVLTVVVIVW